ncbi:unnamed protein product [Toxocara canis]|uniref:Neur_chan_memb domain-containing protein n=1 Tax=Toxocara canis TaxID=6265 RepID=A0A183VBT0_TOXCA|nr:unnamed protein product [Toxocara canis]
MRPEAETSSMGECAAVAAERKDLHGKWCDLTTFMAVPLKVLFTVSFNLMISFVIMLNLMLPFVIMFSLML